MVRLDGPAFIGMILSKNQFIQFLGSSLGVNRMWIKKNDRAPKSECVDLYCVYVCVCVCPKKAALKINSSLTILLSSFFVFVYSYPPHQKK